MRLLDALRLDMTEVVSVVGGGGKTTLMFRLADEIVAAGGQVITTTTTRIFASQTRLAPYHLELSDSCRLAHELPTLLNAYPHILITGPIQSEAGKAFGVTTNLVADIHSILGNRNVVIVVEADGSRMRSLKVPAAHEPMIPDCTRVAVTVTGADVFGHPLNDVHVHRAALAAELVGAPSTASVTPRMVADLILHPWGGMKGVPDAARWIVFLNKTESEDRLGPARETAQLLLSGRADEVLLGAVAAEDPVLERWGRVAAIVLAAGGSTRTAVDGEIKQLLPWGDGTLVSSVVDTALASEASSVVTVLGCQAERVRDALGSRDTIVVENHDWFNGQSTSVQAGLERLPLGTQAAMFLLIDQPGVGLAVLDALIHEYRRTGAPVVAPRVAGRRANPVLFDVSTWNELQMIKGDTGGRALFDLYGDRVAWVDWSEEILDEINTLQDYSVLRSDGDRRE